MGRADQATKVRGMFVRPEQVAALVAQHETVSKVRLEVSQTNGQDVMLVLCETASECADLVAQITDSVRSVLHVRGEVALQPVGSLPNDGKVIDDQREY